MLQHPDFRAGMKALTDMREVTPTALRRDVLRVVRFVREHQEEIGDLRIAVVVPANAEYGLMREPSTELTASPLDIEVFRDIGETRRWLDLGPE